MSSRTMGLAKLSVAPHAGRCRAQNRSALGTTAQDIPAPGHAVVRLTLSPGLASYPADGAEAPDLIRAADDRLLEA